MPRPFQHPGLVRAANEARAAANAQAVIAAKARAESTAGGGSEQAATAKQEADSATLVWKHVSNQHSELLAASENAKAGVSTAKMDLTRLQSLVSLAEEMTAEGRVTLQKLEENLEAAQADEAEQVHKTAEVEQTAKSAWDEAGRMTNQAAVSAMQANEKAAMAQQAARDLSNGQARRRNAEAKVKEAEGAHIAATSAMEQSANEAKEKQQKADQAAEAAASGAGAAKAAWLKHSTKAMAVAAAEAAKEAADIARQASAAAEQAKTACSQAVEAEGPLVEGAADTEKAKVEALEAAARIDLEAKSCDAVARKAEAAARAARVAQQAAEMKVARMVADKEAGEEVVAKGVEEVTAAVARVEAAQRKVEQCEAAARAANSASEAKGDEVATTMAKAKKKQGIAAESEKREAYCMEMEELAATLEEEAVEALANSRSGKLPKGSLTLASACRVRDAGLTNAGVGQKATFVIEAVGANGEPQTSGGDAFFVSIRYSGMGTRVNAQLYDNQDGTYTVTYKPISAGRCRISVTLDGDPLTGSPFACTVHSPQPSASQCTIEGAGLTRLVAAKHETFNVRFRDQLGQTAPYAELDVFLKPAGPEQQQQQLARGTPVTGGAAASPTSSSGYASDGTMQRPTELLSWETLTVGNVAPDVTRDAEPNSELLGKLQPGRVLRVLKVEAVGELGMLRACVAQGGTNEEAGVHSWRDTYAQRQSWRTNSWRAAAAAMERAADDKARERAEAKARAEAEIEAEIKAVAAKAEEELRAVAIAKARANAEADRLKAEAEAEAERLRLEAEAEAQRLADEAAKAAQPKPRKGATSTKTTKPPTPTKVPTSKKEAVAPAPAPAPPAPSKKAKSPGGKKGKAKQLAEENFTKQAAEEAKMAQAATLVQSAHRGLLARREFVSRQQEAKVKAVMGIKSPDRRKQRGMGYGSKGEMDAADKALMRGTRLRMNKLKMADCGWVTVCTKDASYATLQVPRLLAADKVRHEQHWKAAIDSERANLLVAARNETIDDPMLKQRDIDGTIDPPGRPEFGFAFGGVAPGRKAKGALVDSHEVGIAADQAGLYWLHVNMRSEAAPIQGSPFLVNVVPDRAHALMTEISVDDLPLVGSLDASNSTKKRVSTYVPKSRDSMNASSPNGKGKSEESFIKAVPDSPRYYSCELRLQTRDKMGNECTCGGAAIIAGFVVEEAAATCSCTDEGNGFYAIKWKVVAPGEYAVYVKIDGMNILRSPAMIKLTDEPPPPKETQPMTRKVKKSHRHRTQRSPVKARPVPVQTVNTSRQ